MTELVLSSLLMPIPGANPAGEDLRYAGTYDQIKEARREDDTLAQGAWQRERKVADYRLVIRLATQTLAEKSKDLQIAAWLTEALVHEQRYAGLHLGLRLCAGLMERFWDHLYPVLDDDDAEVRAAPLSWLSGKLDLAVRAVPLVAAGHNWFTYKDSRTVGYEISAATPEQKKAREKAASEGRLSAEAFDKALAATPRAFYVDAEAEIGGALTVLKTFDDVCREKFGNAAPSFGKLREAMEELRHTIRSLLSKKGIEVKEEPAQEPARGDQPEESAMVGDPPLVEPAMAAWLAPDRFAQAMQSMRVGQHHEALQVLSRDLATQSCGRGRFLRKLELARVCIAVGKDAIAQPLLDDLASTIDVHKLDEWEEHEVVAAALITIFQSSKRVQSDAKEKQKVFERICRLDPSQALGC